MSGLSLRALLEGSLSLDLKADGFPTSSPKSTQELVAKAVSPTSSLYDASRAYLNRANIWDAPETDSGFNLEYMDLEEFLQETGLESLDRAAIFPPSPSSVVSSNSDMGSSDATSMGLGSTVCTSPSVFLMSASAGQSPKGAMLSASPPASALLSATPPAPALLSASPPASVMLSANTPASRRLSVSQPPCVVDSDSRSAASSVDDEVSIANMPDKSCHVKMSSRTPALQLCMAPVADLTSVASIPGKEGFDPESHKFAPDELVPQPIIKKSRKVYVPEDLKDDRYWARRKKNNYAAKRSRDARRAKENQIIMRAAFLEQHNDELTADNKRLLEENKALTALVQTYKQRLGEK